MSTFAVFGVSLHECVEKEKHKVDDFKLVDKGNGVKVPQRMSAQEHREAIQERAKAMFDRSRPHQLTDLFDSPDFAAQYIDLANKAGGFRDLCIKAKTPPPKDSGSKKKFVWQQVGGAA